VEVRATVTVSGPLSSPGVVAAGDGEEVAQPASRTRMTAARLMRGNDMKRPFRRGAGATAIDGHAAIVILVQPRLHSGPRPSIRAPSLPPAANKVPFLPPNPTPARPAPGPPSPGPGPARGHGPGGHGSYGGQPRRTGAKNLERGCRNGGGPFEAGVSGQWGPA